MKKPRKQKHLVNLEVFSTIDDERLAEMIQSTEVAAKQNQSALHAVRMEQRRRKRASPTLAKA